MANKRLISFTVRLVVAASFIGVQYRITASEAITKPDERWHIKGALSEACTCNVPCTCNFGQGPSPHSYCYSVFSYEIKEGTFGDVKLDGLRFGGIDGAKGNTLCLDAWADGKQRDALEAVARKVMRVDGDRMGRRKLLGVQYVKIEQQYDDRHDKLDIGGAGSFK